MGEVRSILGAKMGQTMRHSMPIYAIAHMDGRTKEGTQTLILWGLGAFFWSYCSTIGVCAERSDIQGLTAGDLVGEGKPAMVQAFSARCRRRQWGMCAQPGGQWWS